MHVINLSFAPKVAVDKQVNLLCEIERWMSVDRIERHLGRHELKASVYVRDNNFDTVFDELETMPEVVFKLPDWSPLSLSAFKA